MRQKTLLLILVCFCSFLKAQKHAPLENLYAQKQYAELLKELPQQLTENPKDPYLNLWYGAALWHQRKDIPKALSHLEVASKARLADALLVQGSIYANMYRFELAQEHFDRFLQLQRRNPQAENLLSPYMEEMERLYRLVSRTEDIQIIDSVKVAKDAFLQAYHLSSSMGEVAPLSQFLPQIASQEVAFANEKRTKIYYSQGETLKQIYTQDRVANSFGNEKKISPDAFGLQGNQAYPFVLSDGLTLYFAAEDPESIGGYDIFVTRFNLTRNQYLTPERLNLPFNSPFNDYLMVIDEQKGVGWFATDRFCSPDQVCVYTFIPNPYVKLITDSSPQVLASRARIDNIKDTWKKGENYQALLRVDADRPSSAQHKQTSSVAIVINDNVTYSSPNQFVSPQAYQLYLQTEEAKKRLLQNQQQLNLIRQEYHTVAGEEAKQALQARILNLEEEVEAQTKDIEEQTKRIRNIENQTLTKAYE